MSTHTGWNSFLWSRIEDGIMSHDYYISTQLSRGIALAWWLGRLHPESPAVRRLRWPWILSKCVSARTQSVPTHVDIICAHTVYDETRRYKSILCVASFLYVYSSAVQLDQSSLCCSCQHPSALLVVFSGMWAAVTGCRATRWGTERTGNPQKTGGYQMKDRWRKREGKWKRQGEPERERWDPTERWMQRGHQGEQML